MIRRRSRCCSRRPRRRRRTAAEAAEHAGHRDGIGILRVALSWCSRPSMSTPAVASAAPSVSGQARSPCCVRLPADRRCSRANSVRGGHPEKRLRPSLFRTANRIRSRDTVSDQGQNPQPQNPQGYGYGQAPQSYGSSSQGAGTPRRPTAVRPARRTPRAASAIRSASRRASPGQAGSPDLRDRIPVQPIPVRPCRRSAHPPGCSSACGSVGVAHRARGGVVLRAGSVQCPDSGIRGPHRTRTTRSRREWSLQERPEVGGSGACRNDQRWAAEQVGVGAPE